jgi:hypothetical protein
MAGAGGKPPEPAYFGRRLVVWGRLLVLISLRLLSVATLQKSRTAWCSFLSSRKGSLREVSRRYSPRKLSKEFEGRSLAHSVIFLGLIDTFDTWEALKEKRVLVFLDNLETVLRRRGPCTTKSYF